MKQSRKLSTNVLISNFSLGKISIFSSCVLTTWLFLVVLRNLGSRRIFIYGSCALRYICPAGHLQNHSGPSNIFLFLCKKRHSTLCTSRWGSITRVFGTCSCQQAQQCLRYCPFPPSLISAFSEEPVCYEKGRATPVYAAWKFCASWKLRRWVATFASPYNTPA